MNVIEDKLYALAYDYQETGNFLRKKYFTTISEQESGMKMNEIYKEITRVIPNIYNEFGIRFKIEVHTKDMYIVEIIEI